MVAHGKPAPDLFLHAAADPRLRSRRLPGRRGQPGRHHGGPGRRHAGGGLHRGEPCRDATSTATASPPSAPTPSSTTCAPCPTAACRRPEPGAPPLERRRGGRRCPRAHGARPARCPSSPPSTSAPPAPAPASSTPRAACSPAPSPRSTSTSADGHAEQSSAQIWQAAAAALRAARAEAAARPEHDRRPRLRRHLLARPPRRATAAPSPSRRPATTAGTPSSGSTTAPPPRPRNAPRTGHRVLDYTGGAMSPEMQIPKLMWLKRHLPATWSRAAPRLRPRRLPHLARHRQPRPLAMHPHLQVDLPRPRDPRLAARLPRRHRPPRPPRPHRPAADRHPHRHRPRPAHARGRRTTSASPPQPASPTGLIDAHAGALGVLGHLTAPGGRAPPRADRRHLLLPDGLLRSPAHDPRRLGPLPRRRAPRPLDERGRPVRLRRPPRPHPAPARPRPDPRHPRPRHRPRHRAPRRRPPTSPRACTSSPTSTATARPSPTRDALGVISGLPLDASFDALARLYWRTCVALALGLRAILERLNQHGYAIDTLHVTGGHTRNPLLMELYADATRCRTVEPVSPRRRPPRHRHGRRRRRRASTPPSPPPAPPCTRAARSASPTRRRRRATSATGGRSWRCSGIGGRWDYDPEAYRSS